MTTTIRKTTLALGVTSLLFYLSLQLINVIPVSAQTSACTTLGSTNGLATYTLSGVQSGDHRLWLRVKSPDGAASLKYSLSGGGALCDQTATASNATNWVWVQGPNLFKTTGGTVTVQLSGTKAGVGVDCFVLTSNTSFTPSGIAGCAGPQLDETPPTISLTSPTNNTTVNNGVVTATATATDNVSVSRVEFYLNNVLTFTDNSSPYTTNLSTTSLSPGSYGVFARAFDAAGNTVQSSTSNIIIPTPPPPPPTPDVSPPTVSISSPTNNATVSGNVIVNVTAADNVGVSRVELIVDGISKSTDSTAPFSFTWATTGITNGPHTMYARAFDAANNMTTSTPQLTLTVNNTVTPPPPPTPKPGDVNGDNVINTRDASVLLINWNKTGATRAQGDLNGDGVVNVRDASLLLANWGK